GGGAPGGSGDPEPAAVGGGQGRPGDPDAHAAGAADLRELRPGDAGAGPLAARADVPGAVGSLFRPVPADGARRNCGGAGMRYFVTIGGRTFEVELSGNGATVDGRPVEAELATVPGTPLRHLLVDGRSFGLVANRGAERGSWDLHLDGQRLAVEVVDERTRAIRAMTGASKVVQGPKPVRAPMPG